MTDSGWTLIARFSNSDSTSWMQSSGYWWYDETGCVGSCTSPSANSDMINQAFGGVTGLEFKITRSDDSSHMKLLRTTTNCLGGASFRSKILSYGNFRNGASWEASSGGCLGSCAVEFVNSYASTYGFGHAICSDNQNNANKYVGFWCTDVPKQTDTGSVIKISLNCLTGDADQGIGITEEAGKFPSSGYTTITDFGDGATASPNQTGYSLNLWVR